MIRVAIIVTLVVTVASILRVGMSDAISDQATYPVRRLEPVDEGRSDPSWTAFRDRLVEAVHMRDRAFVLGIVHPEIRSSFGDTNNGLEGFRREWKLDDPSASPLWDELEQILMLGGTFLVPGTFCAPYLYGRFPEELAAADHIVVIRADIPLFERPSTTSRVLRRASFEILELDLSEAAGRNEEPGWVSIRLPNGQSGYVQEMHVRGPLDHRACFAKFGNDWRMTILLAGD